MVDPIQLDNAQWEAVYRADDHVLVAAGAGTGKTNTVVGRILYLLGVTLRGQRIAKPAGLHDIAAITFTNAAAADLRRKIRAALQASGRRGDASLVDTARIGTIHSFCGDLLREFALRSGRTPGAAVLEEGESSVLVSEVVRDTIVSAIQDEPVPGLDELLAERTVDKLSEWMIRLLTDSDRLATYDTTAHGTPEQTVLELARRAMRALDRRLDEMGATDFDRMVAWARDLLRDPHVRLVLQRRIHTLIVDEFQDVDPVQREIAYLLGDPTSARRDTTRLMLVGDPKQSIYRFRRADVTVWTGVQRDFRENQLGTVVTLQQNYRSVAPVLAFVDRVIGPILDKPVQGDSLADFEVPFIPVNSTRIDGPTDRSVELIVVPITDPKMAVDELRKREAAAIAARALELRTERGRWGGMAVLLTGWGALDIYESALQAVGARTYALLQEGFYSRLEVVDLMMALEAIRDPMDDVALVGFLRGPCVGLRDETLLELATKGKPPLWEWMHSARVNEQAELDRGIRLLRSLGEVRDRIPTAELLERLLEDSGYLAHLALKGDAGLQAIANVQKLVRLARGMALGGVADFVRMLREARKRQEYEGDARLYGESDDVVTLTSIHSAKGLQWDVVFWSDLSRTPVGLKPEGLLIGRDRIVVAEESGNESPEWTAAKQAVEQEEAAERKRVWYVAATRAKDRLIVTGLPIGKDFKKTPAAAVLEQLGALAGETFKYEGQDREFTGVIRQAGPAHGQEAVPPCEPLDPDTALSRPLPPIPVAMGRPRHSATSLLAWNRCPVKHYYKYVAGVREPAVDRRSAAFGSAIARGQVVHDVLEHLREEAELDLLLEDAIGRWDEEAPSPEGREGAEYRAALRAEIEAVSSDPDYRAVADELGARRELAFVHLAGEDSVTEGKLDLAAPGDAGLVLLDVKTSAIEAKDAPARAAHYNVQRDVYVAAAEAIAGQPVERFAFQFSRAGVQVSEAISAELRANGKREFVRMTDAIATGQPALTPFPAECDFCGYRKVGWCAGISGRNTSD